MDPNSFISESILETSDVSSFQNLPPFCQIEVTENKGPEFTSIGFALMVSVFIALGLLTNSSVGLEGGNEVCELMCSGVFVCPSSSFHPSAVRTFTINWCQFLGSTVNVQCSLVQLSDDIKFVYDDVTENHQFCLSPRRLEEIKYQILHGIYVFSPLHFQEVNKEDFIHYLRRSLDLAK
uniref:Uncharacterized protein n=1 Tax=Utricularia reniformis TaxID=192314 RepID=A0A1Y0B1V0_9LAMI|nr:hypothetical protein AEK19_MT1212 [Utricularia reniformis]ART31426.1 hypothetical protein AEK19_MT1212 [Utricularia reniformis]